MDFICWKSPARYWFNPKLLYAKATTTAKYPGSVDWVRSQPLSAFIVLVRQPKKQRKALTFKGKKRQSNSNNVHVRREQNPWVLVASLSLRTRTPKQIVRLYKTRMQIEEVFRDCKSVHYGLCLSQNRRMNQSRRAILCLIAACTIFVLWCIGVASQQTPLAKQVRVNSSSPRAPYSVIFLARLLISKAHFRLLQQAITDALSQVKINMESVLCV